MQNRGKWWYAATLGEIQGGVSERPQRSVTRQADSQDDSQLAGLQRTTTHDRGICDLPIKLRWTLRDGYGRQARGLQNRGRASKILASLTRERSTSAVGDASDKRLLSAALPRACHISIEG